MKRLFAIVLTLALLFSLIACSSNVKPTDSASAKPTAAQSSGSGSPDKPYNVKFAFPDYTGSLTDAKLISETMSKITLEKINCTVELMPISFSTYKDQITLMTSGNEKLDTFSIPMNYLPSMVAQGQMIPITKYLDTTLAGAKKVIGDDYLKACYIGKDLYGIPTIKEFAATYGIIMRTDLIKKYGIDVNAVKKWEDIEPILAKIKQSEPDVIPMTSFSSGTSILTSLFYGTWGLSDMLGDVYIDGKDGKVVSRYEMPEYKYWCNKAYDWYQKGYIYPDVATTQETGESLMKADRVFSWICNAKPGYAEQETRNTGVDLTYVPITQPISSTTQVNLMQVGIPRNCTNVEKTTEFLNLLWTNQDLMTLLVNGIKDTHYTVNDKGYAVATNNKGWQFNAWELGNNFLSLLWNTDPPTKWQDTKALNDKAKHSLAYGCAFDLTSVATEVSACTAVLNQYYIALEDGTVNPEKILPEFNAKLKDAGLEKIIALKQSQLDKYLGK